MVCIAHGSAPGAHARAHIHICTLLTRAASAVCNCVIGRRDRCIVSWAVFMNAVFVPTSECAFAAVHYLALLSKEGVLLLLLLQ